MTRCLSSTLFTSLCGISRIVANTLAVGTIGAAFDEWLLIGLASTEIFDFLGSREDNAVAA